MPAIPLSAAAQLYIEQRTSQRITGSTAGSTAFAAPGSGDTLAALPTIRGAPGANTLAALTERELARSLKRNSAGSRFGAFGER
jgi:hypothetical protein